MKQLNLSPVLELAFFGLLAAGCGSGSATPPDAGNKDSSDDSGHKALDAGHKDAGRDSGLDATDAGSDTSTTGCPATTTTKGPVEGTMSGSTCAYEGIPYAAPPTGLLRWKAPVAPMAWTTARPSKFASWCPQAGASADEDCLYLNVWTPAARPKSPAPVMVFLHGGGFVQGSGEDLVTHSGTPLYDGTHLVAATDSLVVTINYRLGPFGFLSNAALRSEDKAHGSAGNYGILDQIAALEWVRDNIAAFGGDPANVTLFGQSAGGGSIFAHLASPVSRGLFSKVMIESGAGYLWTGLPVNSVTALPQLNADVFGAAFATALLCTDPATVLSCLRGRSTTDVLHAITSNSYPPSAGEIYWGPVVDGYVIPTDPIQAITSGSFTKVPTLIGDNRSELTYFFSTNPAPSDDASYLAFGEMLAPGHGAALVAQYPISFYSESYVDAAAAMGTDELLLCNGRRVARAIAASGTPTFRYDFAHAVSYTAPVAMGAFHGSELSFVFGNEFCWYGPCVSLQPSEVTLSQTMMGYWGAMAKTGDPNGGGRFAWPKYDTTTETELVLDLVQSTETQLEKAQCDLWDALWSSGGADAGSDAHSD